MADTQPIVNRLHQVIKKRHEQRERRRRGAWIPIPMPQYTTQHGQRWLMPEAEGFQWAEDAPGVARAYMRGVDKALAPLFRGEGKRARKARQRGYEERAAARQREEPPPTEELTLDPMTVRIPAAQREQENVNPQMSSQDLWDYLDQERRGIPR